MIVKSTLPVVVYYFSYPKSQEKMGRDDNLSQTSPATQGMKQFWLLMYIGTVLCLYSATTILLIKFWSQMLSCLYEKHQHQIFLKNRLNIIVITFLSLQACNIDPRFEA